MSLILTLTVMALGRKFFSILEALVLLVHTHVWLPQEKSSSNMLVNIAPKTEVEKDRIS